MAITPKPMRAMVHCSKPQPWLRLFLRCESKGDQFYTVEVYETELDMQKAVKREDKGPIDRSMRAAHLAYTARDANGRVTPELGCIYFHKKFITPAALAHEFTHAALSWARRRRMKLQERKRERYATDPEERVCHMVGYMMQQFYEKQKGRVFFVGGKSVKWADLDKEKE